MSDANHPLPWKAVEFRVHGQTVWDITNDAGDESEEYSVTESMDKKTARFIVEACNNHAALKARVAELEELVRHCWVHSGYQDCGSNQMTTAQRELYRSLVEAEPVFLIGR